MPYLVHTIIHFTLNCIASERKRMKPHDSHMTGSKTMETGKHCFMLCFDILKVIYDAAVSVAPEVNSNITLIDMICATLLPVFRTMQWKLPT